MFLLQNNIPTKIKDAIGQNAALKKYQAIGHTDTCVFIWSTKLEISLKVMTKQNAKAR